MQKLRSLRVIGSLCILSSISNQSVNDLGPAGQSYTRASLSFANGKTNAYTIKELLCIGKSFYPL